MARPGRDGTSATSCAVSCMLPQTKSNRTLTAWSGSVPGSGRGLPTPVGMPGRPPGCGVRVSCRTWSGAGAPVPGQAPAGSRVMRGEPRARPGTGVRHCSGPRSRSASPSSQSAWSSPLSRRSVRRCRVPWTATKPSVRPARRARGAAVRLSVPGPGQGQQELRARLPRSGTSRRRWRHARRHRRLLRLRPGPVRQVRRSTRRIRRSARRPRRPAHRPARRPVRRPVRRPAQ